MASRRWLGAARHAVSFGVVAALTAVLAQSTTTASFTASTAAGGNAVGAAAQFCSSPGPMAVTTAVDTTLYQAGANASSNYSANVQIGVSSGNNNNARTLIKFALPRPSGCVLTSATLSLRASAPTAGARIEVHLAAAAWDVTTVTWNTRPGFTGTPATSDSLTAVGVQTWNVTDLVKALLVGPDNGFVIKDSVESATTGRSNLYDSMDVTTPSYRPVLTLTWD